MTDDERYPTVVSWGPDLDHAAPEVIAWRSRESAFSTWASSSTREKFYVPPEANASAALADHPSGVETATIDRSTDSSTKEEGTLAPKKPERLCGLQRRVFWVLVGISVLLIIGAVVGGVLGGLYAQRARLGALLGSGSSETTASPLSTASPTTPLEASKRAITASSTSAQQGKKGSYQVFYQDLDTNKILYRLVWGDNAKGEQKLDSLTVLPIQSTPLAATATQSGDMLGINLFYLSVGSDPLQPTIVQTVLECKVDAEACQMKSNVVIGDQDNLAKGILPSSQLAAVTLEKGTDKKVRVYYQAEDSMVWYLKGESKWATNRVVGPGVRGTSLAATSSSGDGDTLDLAIVHGTSSTVYSIEYADSTGTKSLEGSVDADARRVSSWSAGAKLAICYLPDTDAYRLFYTGADSGDIVSYPRKGTGNGWKRGRVVKDRGPADGGIAAVGWADQLRLLYFSNGKLVVSAQENNTWSEKVYL